jgi:hypothetical protein
MKGDLYSLGRVLTLSPPMESRQPSSSQCSDIGSQLTCSYTAGVAFPVKRLKARWLSGRKMIGAEASPIKVNGAQKTGEHVCAPFERAHTPRQRTAGRMRHPGFSTLRLFWWEHGKTRRPAKDAGLRCLLVKLKQAVVTGIGRVLTNPQPHDRLSVWTEGERPSWSCEAVALPGRPRHRPRSGWCANLSVASTPQVRAQRS